MSKSINEKTDPNYWDKRVEEAKGDEIQLVMNSILAFKESFRIGEGLLKLFIKPGMSVLDIGCGYGRFYETVLAAGGVYTGYDFSLGMLAEAKRRHPQGNFVLHDFTNPHPVAQKFDIVFQCICLSSVDDVNKFGLTLVSHAHESKGLIISIEQDGTNIWAIGEGLLNR